jgi:hypothetical protein
MSDNLKKILLFGGGAVILYYLLKPKTASAAVTQVDVINDTQLSFSSPDQSVEIDLNGAYNINGKQGIDFQVMTYIPTDAQLEYLYGDTVYKGDQSYQTIKTDKAGVQTAINVTNMPDKVTIAATRNTSPVMIFQQSFDWNGNPVS